jgi:hypothetical protein
MWFKLQISLQDMDPYCVGIIIIKKNIIIIIITLTSNYIKSVVVIEKFSYFTYM